MNNSMINSSVSMHSLQQKLDILANNIANVNTTGFKKKEASFEDVLTNIKAQPEAFRQQGRMSPLGFNQGWGARLLQIQTNMAQGSIQPTDNDTDFAIQGDGLFEVAISTLDAEGNPAYRTAWTRNGAFNLTPDGNGNMVLTTKQGYWVRDVNDNPIVIREGLTPKVESDGTVVAYNKNDLSVPSEAVGQLKLVRVVRSQLLRDLGDNLYTLPDGMTAAERQNVLQTVDAQAENAADRVSVMQGYLEQSNVNLSDEMTDLIMVQKAFQLNSRAISSSDQMMNLANNLRG